MDFKVRCLIIYLSHLVALFCFRPATKTLKEYAREFLSQMSEEGRIEYFSRMKPEDVWKMAEGNPKQDNSVTVTDITDYASLRNTPTDTLLTKVNDN